MSIRSIVKPSLTLKRRFNASPATVYSAWTDPQKVMQWMGPEGVVGVNAESDARAGGRFHWVMKSPDGETHDVSGVFREVVPNRKLVFTWAWKSTPERESLVTVEMKPDGDGTLLTLTHEKFFDEAARDRHQHGWTGSLDKLGRYVVT
jgi:uncharacterized protein YndB with AHSA1/START domain